MKNQNAFYIEFQSDMWNLLWYTW